MGESDGVENERKRLLIPKKVLLVPSRDYPLLELNPKDLMYPHMFRQEDVKPVQDVVKYLANNSSRVFLTGSVSERFLYYGHKDYKDINLLAVVIYGKRPDLISTLERTTTEPAISIGSSAFSVVKNNNPITVKARSFMRYTLKSLINVGEFENEKALFNKPCCLIDLTFMNQAEFDRYIMGKRKK
ncbi:MAG: hypothetical protein AABY22_15215 [Nanoarchaeota archaeon]